MLEQKVKILSEGLARSMDRRKFIKGTGTAIFAGLASLAAGHSLAGNAAADDSDVNNVPRTPWPPQCAPPGPYCSNGTIRNGRTELSGCQGGYCNEHLHNGQMLSCEIMYGWYVTGCWTRASQGGYWVCCDCGCGRIGPNQWQRLCGCAQWNHASEPPPPSPDRPAAERSKS